MESKEKLSLFKCVYCEKSFSRASNRSRHMKTTHQKNSRGEEVPLRRFTCEFCDNAYTTKASLQHHLDLVHLFRNKIFKCDRPNCFYKSDRKAILNRHILKVHRPKPNYTEKRKVKCGKCPSTFISRSTLRRHEKKIHKDIHPGNVKRKCPLCPFYSMKKTKEEIIGHFEKSHNLKISTEKHSFVNLDEFNEWKYQLQTNTLATFVKGKASSNQARSLLFICHRRGYFKTKGHNIRHIKMSGSCKINAYCPCEIHAKINKNGCVSVVYYPTHVGHKNDEKFLKRLRRTPLTNNEHTVLMEISNSSQSNKMCKEDLEILFKQLLEATSTNEEISLVEKTLRETIATVKAMKTTATRPLVERVHDFHNSEKQTASLEVASLIPAPSYPCPTNRASPVNEGVDDPSLKVA